MIQTQCKDEADWLAKRRELGIGASEAAMVLGISHFKSPFALAHDKLGLVAPSDEENELFEWGRELEAPIARRYARVTKRPVHEPAPWLILQHEAYPFMFATLDRLVEIPGDPKLAGRLLPLEIKTAGFSQSANWKEEPPIEYIVQVQHQLAVTGEPIGSIGAVVGGQKFVWLDIQRDEEFISTLIEAEKDFWENIHNGIMPPVDGFPSTRACLKALFPKETAGPIALSGDAIEWDNALAAVKAKLDEVAGPLKLEQARLENLFIQAIGNHQAGVLPNGVAYTYRTTKRGSYTVNETEYRTLRRKGGKVDR